MHTANKPSWSLIISCTLGTFLEFFDYTLYGYFAVIISHEFFPLYSSQIQWLATWSVFAIGCLVRPLGALVFGHFADRIGRKKILPYTILLMALPTVGIGLLPGYDAWGWMAPAMLLLCRIIQGLSISAEYNGCSIYCVENRWANSGLLASLTPFSCGLGMLAASLLALCCSQNWRIPFVIAGTVVGIVGWIMRRNLPETLEFENLLTEETIQRFPMRTILQDHKFSVFVNIICSAYMGTASYLLLVYMPSYLQKEFAMAANHSLQFTIILTCLEASACLIFGWLSDRFEQWKTMMLACFSTLFISLMMLFISGSFTFFLLSVVFLTVFLGAFDGPLTSYLPKLVPTSIRYSATAFGYNIGGAAIGGVGPIIVTFLIQKTHAPKMVLISYLALWAFFALICLIIRDLKFTVRNTEFVSD
ncbi:MAG: MFS transporter [Gammaproteobacteria bacterium]|nr:MFS transporter [Gammaproteobacteria bacterium]